MMGRASSQHPRVATTLRRRRIASPLRALAKRSKVVNQSWRLLSLAPVRTAWTAARRPRSAAWTARRCVTGCTASTPRDPDGLLDNWTGGTTPRLSPDQVADHARLVEAGPDREVDGVVHLRQADLLSRCA